MIPSVAKAKRGYSRDFTPKKGARRIKREIDRVPPTLADKLDVALRREKVSLRWLTLTLWRMWAEGKIALPGGEESDDTAGTRDGRVEVG